MANAGPDRSWSTKIDGWVRDATIRRHALIALGMLLLAMTVILIAWTWAGFTTGLLTALVGAKATSAFQSRRSR